MPLQPATVQKGDYGTKFRIQMLDESQGVQPINSALELVMIFYRPDGVQFERTASLDTDGLDGRMKYVTVDGDISMSGAWQVRGRVKLSSTERFTSDAGDFPVGPT